MLRRKCNKKGNLIFRWRESEILDIVDYNGDIYLYIHYDNFKDKWINFPPN